MATGVESSFTKHSGDDHTLEVTVKDEADVVVDITAASAFAFAMSKRDPDAVAPKGDALFSYALSAEITITDGPNGRADIVIDRTDTEALAGEYYFEVQMILGSKKSTVAYGIVTILKDLIP